MKQQTENNRNDLPTKDWFFERINITDKPTTRITMEEREMAHQQYYKCKSRH